MFAPAAATLEGIAAATPIRKGQLTTRLRQFPQIAALAL